MGGEVAILIVSSLSEWGLVKGGCKLGIEDFPMVPFRLVGSKGCAAQDGPIKS